MRKKKGVAPQIKKDDQFIALSKHCYAHSYNLAQGACNRNWTIVSKLLDTYEIKKLVKFSSKCIVPKSVPAATPPLFFKVPNPWPSLPPSFLKSLFPFPSFLFHLLDSSPHPHATPYCPNRWTNLPWFKQISKGRFYQFNCRFLSKINFLSFKSL